MARLWTSGAEFNDTLSSAAIYILESAHGIGGAGLTFDSGAPRSGAFSFKCDSGVSNTAVKVYLDPAITITNGRYYFDRRYIKFTDLPNSPVTVAMIDSGDVVAGCSAKLTSAGKLQLFNVATDTQVGSDSVETIATGVWHRIELMLKIGTGALDEIALKLNGIIVASATGLNQTDTLTTWRSESGWINAPGANKVCNVDDIAFNDDTGSAQNSWPGEGHVVLLVPTSDNARATLWTGGIGGTTNLFDAVDNKPPTGKAAETDITQIEHAGGAAGTTDAYDANMTTYAAAGVAAGDRINLVQLIEVDGEDIATGAKLLNFEIVSNPVVASSGDITAGDNVGALGTYPTNWACHRGTISYNPSVTIGTAPVMRARRPETASRVASVCFMGILVDYSTRSAPVFQRPTRVWSRR